MAAPPIDDGRSPLRRVRGLLLGLCLGDALGLARSRRSGDDEVLRAGVGSQLALVTVEGVIRASVRARDKGICHPPSVVWHSYLRWAARQGIDADEVYRRWRSVGGEQGWPNGWLAEVPALAQRRGSAPATVAAITAGRQGSRTEPATASPGAHALIRSLPVGALVGGALSDAAGLAADVAALTHARPAVEAAELAARALGSISRGLPITDAFRAAADEVRAADGSVTDLVVDALAAARTRPLDEEVLRHLAHDRNATSVLAGAVYLAASAHGDVRRALVMATAAVDAPDVAAGVGALLGAALGADALPVDGLARLELAWVAEVLARDVVAELYVTDRGPSFEEWRQRYPGW